ncbi:retrotransposon gag domain-containing protein, partial [Corynebacterium sp. MC-10]|nr:retrotransposon gag domain-containing protein [Corynebacterium parakroppenstedtii]
MGPLVHLFQDNKSARALALDAKFTNTKLVDFPNVKAYCTRLKVLADNLANVGHKVSDERLVLRLLRGLSDEYKTFRTTVQHRTPLPSFDVVRSMLELEEDSHAEDAIHDAGSPAALVSHNVTPQHFSGNGQLIILKIMLTIVALRRIEAGKTTAVAAAETATTAVAATMDKAAAGAAASLHSSSSSKASLPRRSLHSSSSKASLPRHGIIHHGQLGDHSRGPPHLVPTPR